MSAAAVRGWYGPMIDLSSAASHVGDFVQLLVLVRHCRTHPVQKLKTSNGEAMQKTLVQVGDNTRAFFGLSIVNKNLGSTMHAGDVVLLQNVQLAKYGELIEAVATHISSVQVLLHSFQLVAMTGIDELIAQYQVGKTTREKLRKVVEWAQQTESVLQNIKQVSYQKREQSTKNWKSREEIYSKNCTSVSEVLHLTESCKVNFLACISEMVLKSQRPNEVAKSKLPLGKRLLEKGDTGIMELIICTGCKRCGYPVESRYALEEMTFPLYCPKSTDFLHSVCSIYRPFLLYVWDHAKHITLLVKNKAAEMLFGNITAEDAYKCHDAALMDNFYDRDPSPIGGAHIPGGEKTTEKSWQLEWKSVAKHADVKQKPNFYSIWLLLLKLLLHNENSAFQFEVSVDLKKDQENGRFELISLIMPCHTAVGT